MSMDKPASGILLLDKPEGITSQTAVGKIRRLLGMKTVGHTGTLDPMATGLLPICFGRATRASEYMIGHDKRYQAGLLLGLETDTGDTTGAVLARSEQTVTAAQVAAVLSFFKGPQSQTPPMYSAVKQQGKKLYELARQGLTVERAPRDIEIYELSLLEANEEKQEFLLDVACSKGTYIRVLCQDIGLRLGVLGTMSSLRRSAAGQFSIEQAYTPEQLQAMADAGDYSFVRPVDEVFAHLPAAVVNGAGEAKIKNGAGIAPSEIVERAEGPCRIYGPGGFLALGQGGEGGRLTAVKSFYEV